MTQFQVGGASVTIPDSLELDTNPVQQDTTVVDDRLVGERVKAFETLFPDCHDPAKVLPIEGQDVYILDARRNSKFVHVAQYSREHGNFESDGGWFERVGVDRWAHVPNIDNERARTIPAQVS